MEHLRVVGWPLNEYSDVIPGVAVVMIRCLDSHTHHPAPQPEGIISATMDDFNPVEGQLYSLGIHPWVAYNEISHDQWVEFESLCSLPSVVAIGECGIDKLKGGLLFKQMLVFNRQIEISERLRKPLIIHDVKAHDVIVGLKRDLNPSQKWMVHGMRGKPTVAKMLTDAGIYISFGEYFNPGTLKATPLDMILAETDESSLSIEDILNNISLQLDRDVTPIIAENTKTFFFDEPLFHKEK